MWALLYEAEHFLLWDPTWRIQLRSVARWTKVMCTGQSLQ